MYVEKNTWIRV